MARCIDADALKRDLIDNKSFYPAIVKNAIESAPIIYEWIDVKERLPESNDKVLCYVRNDSLDKKTYVVGNCHNGKYWFLQTSIGITTFPVTEWIVTHWMKLPERPEGKKNEKNV